MFARGSVDVTCSEVDSARIPDSLVEGACLLLDLRQRGILDEVAKKLHIRRQGGYSGLGVWLLLVLYMSTGAGMGIRKFWDLGRPHMASLGALAGRSRLPSPASLSRALDAVELDLLRPVGSWLLWATSGIDEVLRHSVSQHRDAVGTGWLVFDADATVTTLRQRALPEGPELPVAHRRSAETGAPGHAGRKRGNLQFREMSVQQAGAGAWVHCHLSPGNGEGVVDFERALDSVVETCARLGHPLERALVRMDGEFGNVPWFTACRERKVPFITRLNRPKLLQDPDILHKLGRAAWSMVPDSGSGPKRSATELGELTIHPGRDTRRPDGSRYEPVRMRVVASRFPTTGPAKAGRLLDGWQVELFAVDVSESAWPAPEAVESFMGRAGQENRFAQEDREQGLARIISYHLPGQELAVLVGRSLWNLRIARGFAMERPGDVLPLRRPRTPRRDDRADRAWPADPVLARLLAEVDWSSRLLKRPGWQFDATAGRLLCEEGRPLVLTTVRSSKKETGRVGLVFCRPKDGCVDCIARPTCLSSPNPRTAKHAEFTVPDGVGAPIDARLREVRAANKERADRVLETEPPLEPMPSLFLPARARQRFRDVFRGATVHTEIQIPAAGPPQPVLVATDVPDRQRRRKTWADNVDRHALPEGTRVAVNIAAGPDLQAVLNVTGRPIGTLAGTL